MTRARRHVAGALAAALGAILLASGCSAIPTSGPVETGQEVVGVPEPAFPIPGGGPALDAPPASIVAGFIEANTAGVRGDLSYALDHLTAQAKKVWKPDERVVIFGPGDVNDEWEPKHNRLRYTIPVAAYVDADGRMTEAPPGTSETLEFTVTQGVDHQWRIAALPNGVVLSEASFQALYRDVSLAFSTPDGQVAVGERRWLPARFVGTDAASALIGGPSPWLADAVTTGIPAGTTLEVDSVPVVTGNAQVVLGGASFGTLAERGLITRQFEVTLTQLPNVVSVDVLQGTSGPIGGDDTYQLAPSPVPGPRAVVIVNGMLGRWDGTDIQVVSGDVGGLPEGASKPALSYDGQRAAYLVGDELHVTSALTTPLIPLADALAPATVMESTVVAKGHHLVEPSFDRHHWLWTGEATNDGSIIAISPDGERQDVAVPWLEGRELVSVKVARDGSRIAVLSHAGGVVRLDVAGLVRGEEGVPLSVSTTTLEAGTALTRGVALAWVDDQTLAVLADSEPGETPALHIVQIGGRTTTVLAVPDAVGLASRNGESTIAVITRNGSLHVRTSSGWSAVSVGDLAAAITGIAYAG